MELKITTARALEYEARTGVDIVEKMKEIGETGVIKVKDTVELFKACGENYTVEMFDAWDVSFAEKAKMIVEAVKIYLQGQGSKKQKK